MSFVSSASSGIRKRSESHTLTSQKKSIQLKQLQPVTDGNKPSSEGTIFDWDMKTFKEKVSIKSCEITWRSVVLFISIDLLNNCFGFFCFRTNSSVFFSIFPLYCIIYDVLIAHKHEK